MIFVRRIDLSVALTRSYSANFSPFPIAYYWYCK